MLGLASEAQITSTFLFGPICSMGLDLILALPCCETWHETFRLFAHSTSLSVAFTGSCSSDHRTQPTYLIHFSPSLQVSHGRTHTRSSCNRSSITKSLFSLFIFSIRNPRRFFRYSFRFTLNFCNFSTNPFWYN